MYCTDEMISVLKEWDYVVDICGYECDIYFRGSYVATVSGEYGLHNWMCDRELL